MEETLKQNQREEIKKIVNEALVEFFSRPPSDQATAKTVSDPLEDKLISLTSVRKILKCSLPKLYKLRKAKRFPSDIKIGNNIFFDKQKFIEFLNNGGTKSYFVK